jgi:hypothetical protein
LQAQTFPEPAASRKKEANAEVKKVWRFYWLVVTSLLVVLLSLSWIVSEYFRYRPNFSCKK